ncbi:hypothetical protein KEM54_004472 [Ascosphaera aggregata]|nr:hypothetical protein KEM54_004472 [Ascosphaera aggregata]
MHLGRLYKYASVVTRSVSGFHPLLTAYSPVSQFTTTAKRDGTRKPAFHRNTRRRQRKEEVERQTEAIRDLADSVKLPGVQQLQMLDCGSAHDHAISGSEQDKTTEGEDDGQANDASDDASTSQCTSPSDIGTGQPGCTRPSHLLPRSMLEIRLSTKRNRVPKRRATLETSNRNPLAYNPYAQALASPIRTCHVTGARLPSHLLTGFGLVQHPDTRDMWFMPTQLLKDYLRIGDSNTGDENVKRPTTYIPPVYLSTTQPLMKALSKKSQKHLGKWLMPMRWKVPYGTITKPQERKAVWREDMNVFVLNQLRRKVLTAALKTHLYAKEPRRRVDVKSNVALDLGSGGFEKVREALASIQWVDQGTEAESAKDDVDLRSCGAVIIITNKGVAPKPANDVPNVPTEEEQHRQSEEGVEQVVKQAVDKETTWNQTPDIGPKTADRIIVPNQLFEHELLESAREQLPQLASADQDRTAESEHSPARAFAREQQPQAAPISAPYTFPDLVRAPFANCEIPIFDLSKLLTDAQMSELRTKGHNQRLYSQNGAFFLQPSNGSASKFMMTLWSLRCYIGGEG